MSLLLCPRTAMPDLCGQRIAKKCFYSVHLASLVSEKTLPTSHTYADAHTLTSSASSFTAQPLSGHTTQAHKHTPMHTHNPSPPAANKKMKNEDSEMELPAMTQGEFG
ncbi:hypothetical protein PAMP_000372 [Pampus punctatissimus]